MIKVCENCHKEFETKSYNTKYCNECKHKCIVCGKYIENIVKNRKCCSRECSQKLRKQNCLNKYGVDSPSKVDKIKNKVKQTKLQKYGDENYNNRKQASITFKEKYGVNSSFQLENTKQTILKKYGVDNVTKNKNILNKSLKTNRNNHLGDLAWNTYIAEQTMLNKYGVKKPLQSDEIRQKWIKTNIEKYGHRYVLLNKNVINKAKQTNIDKYGVDNPMKSKEVKDKIRKTVLEKYGVQSIFELDDVKEKIKKTMLNKYGVPYYCMTDNCKNANGFTISKINERFSDLLKQNGIDNQLEFPINNYSYDIHILNTNILIEINPTYTHNSTYASFFNNSKPKDKNYHLNKTKLAEENNYRCIHIFDWDDIQKIVNILKPKKKISAHKTVLKEISKKEANEFLNKYHLQNSCKGNDINIGLYYKDILVSIVTFGKSRYNKNYEYEFLRFCNHENYSIFGGTNKLFNYFVENYNPTSIISYSDRAKFEGKFFNDLNFIKINTSNPACHWYNMKTKQHFLDNSLRAIGADRLLKTNYGSIEKCGMNNKDIMLNEGFVEVYDCGQSVYVWKNKNKNK